VGREDLSIGAGQAAQARVRDIATIDSELRSVAALRRAARKRGGPLPLIDVADALLDERLRAQRVGYNPRVFLQSPSETPA
jgi:C4-dicarboxylate-specific signal transduction histidine kinase